MREDLKRGKMGGGGGVIFVRTMGGSVGSASYLIFVSKLKAKLQDIASRREKPTKKRKGKYVTLIDKNKSASSRNIDVCFVQL